MKKTTKLLWIYFVMILALTSATDLFSQDFTKDKKAIQKLYVDMGEAFMNKDWERYQSYWVQDTTLNVLHPGNRDWAIGWNAVKMRYKPLFSPEVNMQAELVTETFEVYIAPTGDFAWSVIDLKVNMENHQMQSWQVAVYRKIDGKWRVNLVFDAELPSSNEN
jgi:ketosteroid isomerase-like protein